MSSRHLCPVLAVSAHLSVPGTCALQTQTVETLTPSALQHLAHPWQSEQPVHQRHIHTDSKRTTNITCSQHCIRGSRGHHWSNCCRHFQAAAVLTTHIEACCFKPVLGARVQHRQHAHVLNQQAVVCHPCCRSCAPTWVRTDSSSLCSCVQQPSPADRSTHSARSATAA